MNDEIIISVIIATFNSEKYLEKSLDSIAKQTFKNYEVILVDNLSTDNTLLIAKKYHFRIKIIKEKDNGLSEALNKGFKKAEGKLCTFIGADDMFYEDAFSRVYQCYLREPSKALYFFDVVNIDELGHFIGYYDSSKTTLNSLLNIDPTTPAIGAFYATEQVKLVGYFNEKYKQAMDYDLFIRLMKTGGYKYCGNATALFRLHSSNLTVTSGRYYSPIETFLTAYHEGGNIYSVANYLRLKSIIKFFIKSLYQYIIKNL